MRFQFLIEKRLKLGSLTVFFKSFFMISHTQDLEGLTSKVGKNEHIILWDLDKCTLDEAIKKLADVQFEFRLGNIFIVSDAEKSFRAWCFSRRSFLEYVHILIHTFPLLDFGFFIWTIRRTASTLRVNDKEGRPSQKVVAYLQGYEKTLETLV
jgi:hypothetical protein